MIRLYRGVYRTIPEQIRVEREARIKRNRYQRGLRKRRAAKGQCGECKEPRVLGKTLCERHLGDCNRKTRVVYYIRKKMGWCTKCGGDKEPGRENLVRCLECHKDAVRRKRERSKR